ncbi:MULTISPECIES: AlbA family DNA-binding domain-containing protein [unclassified Arthrobacter]|uniref:AlbA family DNA-binding domain-containing protein n=1 Tax=unclassified Arthrobacter TaxID=235627 RepID=UPI00041CFD0D|nr:MULTISPECIES: RNA-binding domain-containing protein [unclassified Arthrobacter]PVE14836.1 hypothetical protein DDA93_15520 [Arthrobacter sp. Bz4]
MLSDEEVAAYLAVGNELRAIEFKGPLNTESPEYIAKVARAALAMANQRDGGYVILGVIDDDPMSSANGLSQEHLAYWSNQDWVADKINRFADPPLDLNVATRRHPSGGSLAVIKVAEFSQVPSLCMRDSAAAILKSGQLYTRSIRKPESTSYHTQNEVRELLDLAIAKGLRRYIETGQAAGISFDSVNPVASPYQDQIDLAYNRVSVNQITTQPHFRHLIYPQRLDSSRIPYSRLTQVVNDATVRLRGWPFPFVQNPSRDEHFIHETTAYGHHLESWAMFTSGLFADIRRIGDWPSDGDTYTSDDDPRIAGNMPMWFALLHFTEALEFAVRLRQAMNQEEPMVVRFEGLNLSGQRLVVANNNRSGFFSNYIYEGSTWSSGEYLVDDDAALKGTRTMAVDASLDLIARFGWDSATPAMLQGIQEETFDR